MSNEWSNLHISQLPEGWGQVVQLNYLAQLEATKVAGETATEANDTASQAKEEVEQQGSAITSISETVKLQGQQIKLNTEKSSNAVSTANTALNTANETKQDLQTHEQDRSAHGVTGVIVGTEDFAQADVGGVSLLANKVEPLEVNTVRVDDAPEAYDQAHEQSVVDAVRSLAIKQNDIIGKVNELIQALQDAKQMQSDSELG